MLAKGICGLLPSRTAPRTVTTLVRRHLHTAPRVQSQSAERIEPSRRPCIVSASPASASSGEGLPSKRGRPRKIRQSWHELTSGNDGSEHQDEDAEEPISLAALSRAHGREQRPSSQRTHSKNQLAQAHVCAGLPNSGSASSPGTRQAGPPAQLPAGRTPPSSGSGFPPAPILSEPDDLQDHRPIVDLDANPGLRHPPVSFRTAAELRRMLQERQLAAAETALSASPPAKAEQAGRAAPAGTSRPSPDVGGTSPAPPPRRFFAPPLVAVRPPSASATAPMASGASSVAAAVEGSAGLPASKRRVVVVDGDDGSTSTSTSGLVVGRSRSRATVFAVLEKHAGNDIPESQAAVVGATARPTDTARATSSGVDHTGQAHDLEEDRDYQKAKQTALSLLERSPLPRAELGRRLLARGHPRGHVDALLDWLVDSGVLSDRLYARMYAASKWNANLTAPSKIRKDLTTKGVCAEDVTAALAHVFGPSQRIRLTGATTAEELEVREALLEGARRHVEQRSGGGAGAESATPSAGSLQISSGARSGGRDSSRAEWVAAAKAKAKERDTKRRRLAMWLQYRGHEIDVVLKVFELLKI